MMYVYVLSTRYKRFMTSVLGTLNTDRHSPVSSGFPINKIVDFFKSS